MALSRQYCVIRLRRDPDAAPLRMRSDRKGLIVSSIERMTGIEDSLWYRYVSGIARVGRHCAGRPGTRPVLFDSRHRCADPTCIFCRYPWRRAHESPHPPGRALRVAKGPGAGIRRRRAPLRGPRELASRREPGADTVGAVHALSVVDPSSVVIFVDGIHKLIYINIIVKSTRGCGTGEKAARANHRNASSRTGRALTGPGRVASLPRSGKIAASHGRRREGLKLHICMRLTAN